MARIVYSGDINVEHGGVWFKIDPRDWDEYGYCSAVRVTPCSDAGLQENAWWIEELTIIKPRSETELSGILNTCGWMIYTESGDIIASGNGEVLAKKGTAAFRRIVAEATLGYGLYDVTGSETVQIGREADGSGERVTPDTVLRSNASLERYVRREHLRSM